MRDRGFSDSDLREMLETATDFHPDVELGRWIVETRWDNDSWHVIVEPDLAEHRLLVVTAYRINQTANYEPPISGSDIS
jgi:hypothetical protein